MKYSLKDWEWKKIGELIEKEEIINPIEVFNSSNFDYVDISAIDGKNGRIVNSEIKSISPKEAPSRARKKIIKGDVIVSTVRPNLKATALVKEKGDVASTGFAVLRPTNNINSDYLFYFTRLENFTSELIKNSTGANYPAVRIKDILQIKIPIPPLHTQQKIVSILKRAESLKQKREQANEEANKIIQSIFYKMFGDPIKNEKLWKVQTIEDVCIGVTDGTHLSPEFAETGIPMLDSKDISGLSIDDSNPTKFISRKTDEALAKRCKPQEDDILISSRGTIGKIALVKKGQNFNIMGNIILLRPNRHKIFPRFLGFYLTVLNKELNRLAHGASQMGLYLTQIKDVKLVVPNYETQKQFVTKAENIIHMQQLQKQSTQEINVLFDALMQKAFNGGLVN